MRDAAGEERREAKTKEILAGFWIGGGNNGWLMADASLLARAEGYFPPSQWKPSARQFPHTHSRPPGTSSALLYVHTVQYTLLPLVTPPPPSERLQQRQQPVMVT